jgi:acetylornithine/succinyldiaminopimelate/putrescine aminotransferase
MGSMSVMGFEERKASFPSFDTWCRFYYLQQRRRFTKNYYQTAGIILETIQGGAGFIQPQNDFLKKVRKRCTEVGAMMILDEIQPGFDEQEPFWFQNYDVPDIVVMGKGMVHARRRIYCFIWYDAFIEY